eukprot:TRINITY_DN31979_c0_g1_i1.p1 TRINITY_DN31979_c0_g1~~TRINITY_DN31979_c0_g1_i1.p1  ORF type:complete len:319 (+),score=39.14 TRINITY_DN31979_c0_g1_i1:180-1136(+)
MDELDEIHWKVTFPFNKDFEKARRHEAGSWTSERTHVRNVYGRLNTELSCVREVRWKDAGDNQSPAEMSLEAYGHREWRLVSKWKTARTTSEQRHAIPAEALMRSREWRVTFICTHGPAEHICLEHLAFFASDAPSEKRRCVEMGLASEASFESDMGARTTLGHKLLSDRKFADVKVICGAETIHAHRNVLAASSPVFLKMLESSMLESRSHSVTIEDTDCPASVKYMIEFMYTGELRMQCGRVCASLVLLGHKYDVVGLVEAASLELMDNLSAANIVDVLKLLRPYADDALVHPLWMELMGALQDDTTLLRPVVATL